ncbi:hypothetical protein EYF80_055430 [Liparis tanakae]|uniref:Uncharacterized protein n=1 Tax=Liparis tanakae TaxID=230148 RepID=A0A4Z2F186_9TELE|nr:hypothetical protein EYF80_055430 [Liparis tanakae]
MAVASGRDSPSGNHLSTCPPEPRDHRVLQCLCPTTTAALRLERNFGYSLSHQPASPSSPPSLPASSSLPAALPVLTCVWSLRGRWAAVVHTQGALCCPGPQSPPGCDGQFSSAGPTDTRRLVDQDYLGDFY